MDHNFELSRECHHRLVAFQTTCRTLMLDKRGVVDDETYDMLSSAYALTGNAANEINILLNEIKELKRQLTEK